MTPLKSVLTFRSSPPVKEEKLTAETLLTQYKAVRKQTDDLAASLSAEDQMVQSCPEASPTKWHLAHTSWFFETFLLSQHLGGYRPLNPQFRNLFNSYYNAVGPQPEKALRNTFSRPTLDEVQVYRRYVDEHMHKLLGNSELSESVLKTAELGTHHEQQHQELIVTDIKHAFWINPLRPAYQRTSEITESERAIPPQRPQAFEEDLYEIGSEEGRFHFDNESPRHKVLVSAFRLGTRLVTCGEYLAFIEERGYARPELWLSDGWKAVEAHRWVAPLYWEKVGREWFQFTCSGVRKLDDREPVCHVSYYEADAFARWAGARLPTEFEWEVAASQLEVNGNLLENARFHPTPASNAQDDKPLQVFGDVWEWTASAYLPYHGYKPAAGALGEYNGKFMCNQMVLRGGSCITPKSHVRASYRNFFTPETRWQFSGIRLADDSI
ncbi:MAG TPA: ergothioneine biosynthesis protein EgtB [Candidatus Solibacter sp.]|nr:ergothioneine biosynthesis protein EgtB [Candidatus Solibacter sp.]